MIQKRDKIPNKKENRYVEEKNSQFKRTKGKRYAQ